MHANGGMEPGKDGDEVFYENVEFEQTLRELGSRASRGKDLLAGIIPRSIRIEARANRALCQR